MSAGAPPIVVDANVALKWVVAEPLSAQARALLSDHLGTNLVAPPHFQGEVTNALYRRAYRSTNPITPIEARRALQAFLPLRITTVLPAGLYQRAFDLAEAHGIGSIYDCLYVAAADLLGGTFWTADQHLINALGRAGGNVRFLGTYPLPPRS